MDNGNTKMKTIVAYTDGSAVAVGKNKGLVRERGDLSLMR